MVAPLRPFIDGEDSWTTGPSDGTVSSPPPMYSTGGVPNRTGNTTATTEWLNWVSSLIPNGTATDAGRQLTMVADREPIPLIYGEDRVGAMVLNVIPVALGGVDCVLFQLLWGYPCDSMVGDFPTYNDEELPPVSDALGKVHFFYTGYEPDSTNSLFSTAFKAISGVDYADTLAGWCVSYIYIPVNKFTGSLKFEAVLKGRRVYDPRSGLTAWSDNPALCDADFLVNFCGKTVDYSTVGVSGDYSTLSSTGHAANANDALVASEKRRTLNVTFKGRENARSVSETLRAYSATFHIPGANGIKLIPDRPGASVATYTHAAGQIRSVKVSKKDSGNFPTESEVVYTNRTVIPWKDDSVFVAVAGVGTTVPRRLTTVRLPGINRYSQARREAWERLNRMRTSDLVVSLEVFDIGIRHEEGDIITVNHPLWNLNKLFRVGDPEALSNGGWRLPCIEYSDSGYSDDSAMGPTYPDTGFTNPALPPATPTGLTHAHGTNGIELTWNANPELTVTGYELRKGASWEVGTPLIGSVPTIVSGTTFVWPAQVAASYTIWIKAMTGIGTYSTTAASHAFTLAAPVMGPLTSVIEGSNYVLSWTLTSSDLPVSFYRVKKAGVEVAQISSNRYTAPIDWTGDKAFSVTAVDVAGNESSAATDTLTVNGPGTVFPFTASVVQNTVLFYWTAPAVRPLPIAYYRMKRGTTAQTYAQASDIGNKAGDQTFTTYFEGSAGEYKYWIAAVDTAGVEGTPASLTQRVSGVTNFQILEEWTDGYPYTGTKTNAVVWDGVLLLPVNSTETFTQHFTAPNNQPAGYTTPSAQIAAGYPLYIEPTAATGSYEQEFDYGATLTAAMVTFTWTATSIGSPVYTPHIDKWDGTQWVSVGDVAQAVVSGFSKVRCKLTVSSTGGDDLVTLTSIAVRLDVQVESDGGTKLASEFTDATDDYCLVEFNKDFVDVQGITVTPQGTSATKIIAVVEFVDEANPQSFKVYTYRLSDGVNVPTNFSWTAVGVI